MTEANIRLGETALELLAWDRHRTLDHLNARELADTDRLVADGADCHQRLLIAVHGADDDDALRLSDTWLEESRARWKELPTMVEKGPFPYKPKLRLTKDDFARLDRLHPESSFSGAVEEGAGPAGGDLVERLERLGALRTKGLLSEEEFQAAKLRLLD